MKKLMAFTLAILIFGLSGCATFDDLDKGLSSLRGISQNELFNALGYPDGQMQIDENTVIYAWGNDFSASYSVPTSQVTTGYVGSTPFTFRTFGTENVNVKYQCNIKYVVKGGRAYTYEYSGNIGGCMPYIERIKSHPKNNPLDSPRYDDCVKENAKAVVKSNNFDFATSVVDIEKMCMEISGYISPNLANYYIRQEIDNYNINSK